MASNTVLNISFSQNTNIPTKEFNKYFEHEIATYASNSVHPLIAQFSKQFLSPDPLSSETGDGMEVRNQAGGPVKRKKLIITSSEGLSLSMKAVWTMSLALKKIEDQQCVPTNLSKVECIEKLKGIGFRELILNQTRERKFLFLLAATVSLKTTFSLVPLPVNYDKLSGLGVASLVSRCRISFQDRAFVIVIVTLVTLSSLFRMDSH